MSVRFLFAPLSSATQTARTVPNHGDRRLHVAAPERQRGAVLYVVSEKGFRNRLHSYQRAQSAKKEHSVVGRGQFVISLFDTLSPPNEIAAFATDFRTMS